MKSTQLTLMENFFKWNNEISKF